LLNFIALSCCYTISGCRFHALFATSWSQGRCAARRCAQTGQGCDCDGDGNVTGGGDVTFTVGFDITRRSNSSQTVMMSVFRGMLRRMRAISPINSIRSINSASYRQASQPWPLPPYSHAQAALW
jgi:hypothetical protein